MQRDQTQRCGTQTLNPAQQRAVDHGGAAAARPLLVIAGAGTGKTGTLAHRVAHLMQQGVDPQRLLLLTFSRRAATELERRVGRVLQARLGAFGSTTDALAAMRDFTIPAAAAQQWQGLLRLCETLRGERGDWPCEIDALLAWYEPQLERLYEDAAVRAPDLAQLRRIAPTFTTRERFLTELTLDPPAATSGEAADPLLDEDYLTLVMPQRFQVRQQPAMGDRHVYASASRFLNHAACAHFDQQSWPQAGKPAEAARQPGPSVDLRARVRGAWARGGSGRT